MSAARDWMLDSCSQCGALAGEGCLEGCTTRARVAVPRFSPSGLDTAIRHIEIAEGMTPAGARLWHLLRDRARIGLVRVALEIGRLPESALRSLTECASWPEVARMAALELERREALCR